MPTIVQRSCLEAFDQLPEALCSRRVDCVLFEERSRRDIRLTRLDATEHGGERPPGVDAFVKRRAVLFEVQIGERRQAHSRFASEFERGFGFARARTPRPAR